MGVLTAQQVPGSLSLRGMQFLHRAPSGQAGNEGSYSLWSVAVYLPTWACHYAFADASSSQALSGERVAYDKQDSSGSPYFCM